jgi:ATP-dependent DNA helicase DinG
MDVASVLSKGGLFERRLEQFVARDYQVKLSLAIWQAINKTKNLVSEAGTGVGKTFAYLVPAILSKQQTIISTGTLHLQDQLFYSDIPKVLQVLEQDVDVKLLKGRSNYLCLHNLSNIQNVTQNFNQYYPKDDYNKIINWAHKTNTGDISDVTDVRENSLWWNKVTSTSENCLKKECHYIGDCFLYRTRKEAFDADILVINHHLLCADMAIKEKSDNENQILPDAKIFIVDEAHKVEQSAVSFFSEHLGFNQINNLCFDINTQMYKETGDFKIKDYTDALVVANQKLRAFLGDTTQKQNINLINKKQDFKECIKNILTKSESIKNKIEKYENNVVLATCILRLEYIVTFLQNWQKNDDTDKVSWYETHKKYFILHNTPLKISKIFKKQMDTTDASWIFTSATISVNNSFVDFKNRIGLEQETEDILLDSPFDYKNNSVLWTNPRNINPNNDDFIPNFINSIMDVIKASKGRCFLLFSSYKSLWIARDILAKYFSLLVQGDMPKMQLVEKFITDKKSILLGTKSFYEGVDVQGIDLSCVIIDKLPFLSPNDPIYMAKAVQLAKQNISAFEAISIPDAVITLKQGAGRLIRGINDRGVLLIGDSRITHKKYGKFFLNSISHFPHTQNLNNIINFLYER